MCCNRFKFCDREKIYLLCLHARFNINHTYTCRCGTCCTLIWRTATGKQPDHPWELDVIPHCYTDYSEVDKIAQSLYHQFIH